MVAVTLSLISDSFSEPLSPWLGSLEPSISSLWSVELSPGSGKVITPYRSGWLLLILIFCRFKLAGEFSELRGFSRMSSSISSLLRPAKASLAIVFLGSRPEIKEINITI